MQAIAIASAAFLLTGCGSGSGGGGRYDTDDGSDLESSFDVQDDEGISAFEERNSDRADDVQVNLTSASNTLSSTDDFAGFSLQGDHYKVSATDVKTRENLTTVKVNWTNRNGRSSQTVKGFKCGHSFHSTLYRSDQPAKYDPTRPQWWPIEARGATREIYNKVCSPASSMLAQSANRPTLLQPNRKTSSVIAQSQPPSLASGSKTECEEDTWDTCLSRNLSLAESESGCRLQSLAGAIATCQNYPQALNFIALTGATCHGVFRKDGRRRLECYARANDLEGTDGEAAPVQGTNFDEQGNVFPIEPFDY